MSTSGGCLKRVEYFWIRCVQGHELSSSRVLEIEVSGVKRQTANGIGSGAVVLIADYRMTGVGEMYADLVLPSRLQAHFEHCRFSVALQDMHVSYCQFSDLRVWG
jgi:hypothetical protein